MSLIGARSCRSPTSTTTSPTSRRCCDNQAEASQTFAYDELGRLTDADGHYGDIDYTYDGVDNRTARTIETDDTIRTEQYTYESGSHRLKEVATTEDGETTSRQFRHDAAGGTVSDISPQRALELSVRCPPPATASLPSTRTTGRWVRYTYNALGQRVAKTSRYRGRLHAHYDHGQNSAGNNNLVPSEAEGPHNNVVLSDNEGPQRGKAKNKNQTQGKSANSAKGHPTRNPDGLHTHYDNKPGHRAIAFPLRSPRQPDRPRRRRPATPFCEYLDLGHHRIAMTAVSLDKPVVIPGNAKRSRRQQLALYYIHNDHLGTPMKVTDREQRVVWSMEQTPFGEVALTTEGVRMPMRFPGQYADLESAFSLRLCFRTCDPSLGRYIQS
ncbi:MAG: RHS domain-containing protein [Gammaproteobacteria bacterium]|nr:RHS domain-containing protein [Gammaproteobacteria bacterium]